MRDPKICIESIGNERVYYNLDQYKQEMIMRMKKAMEQVAKNLEKAKVEQKDKYDRRVKTTREYKIGDIVWVQKPNLEGTKKLKEKWDGPFRVIKVLSNNLTYILRHSEKQTEEIVHYNRIKPGFYPKPWKVKPVQENYLDTDEIAAPVLTHQPYQFLDLFNNHNKWEELKEYLARTWMDYLKQYNTKEDLSDSPESSDIESGDENPKQHFFPTKHSSPIPPVVNPTTITETISPIAHPPNNLQMGEQANTPNIELTTGRKLLTCPDCGRSRMQDCEQHANEGYLDSGDYTCGPSTSGAKEPKTEFTRFLKPMPAEDFKRLYSLESPTELKQKRIMQRPAGLRQKMTSEDTGDSSTDTEAHGSEGLTLREKLWRKVRPTRSPKGPSKSAAQIAKQLKLKAKQQEEKLMQKFDEATKIRSHSDSDVTKKSCKHYGEKEID